MLHRPGRSPSPRTGSALAAAHRVGREGRVGEALRETWGVFSWFPFPNVNLLSEIGPFPASTWS